jgi:hypothetical protein
MRIDDAKPRRKARRPSVAMAAAILAWNATPEAERGPHPSSALNPVNSGKSPWRTAVGRPSEWATVMYAGTRGAR